MEPTSPWGEKVDVDVEVEVEMEMQVGMGVSSSKGERLLVCNWSSRLMGMNGMMMLFWCGMYVPMYV